MKCATQLHIYKLVASYFHASNKTICISEADANAISDLAYSQFSNVSCEIQFAEDGSLQLAIASSNGKHEFCRFTLLDSTPY